MTAKQRERVNGLRREIQAELESWTMLELHYRVSSEANGGAFLPELPPEFVRPVSLLPKVNWGQIDQSAQEDLHTEH